mgnify:CR=1 FL=1
MDLQNQLGRRNLTPEQKKFLMGKQYSSEKRTEAFRGNQHTVKKSGSVQSGRKQKPMKTCERIAQENHSSASSVRRAEYYAHGVDVADELSPGFRDWFFREELHIPDYLLENLGKAKPEEQAEIFEEIKNYVPKPKKVKPNKVTVKQAEKAASRKCRVESIRALAPDKNWNFDFLARLCHGGTIKGACV